MSVTVHRSTCLSIPEGFKLHRSLRLKFYNYELWMDVLQYNGNKWVLVSLSIGQSIRQSVSQSVCQWVGRSVGRSVSWSVLRPVDQSVNQPQVAEGPRQQPSRRPRNHSCITAAVYTNSFWRTSTVCGLNKNSLPTKVLIVRIRYLHIYITCHNYSTILLNHDFSPMH